MTLLEAMAREEGFGIPGARATRNKNPGDIEDGKFARAHGALSGDKRFAVFPTAEAGFDAMRALLLSAYKGMTIQEMLFRYAPPHDNQTSMYLANVLRWTGLNPQDIIDEHLIS